MPLRVASSAARSRDATDDGRPPSDSTSGALAGPLSHVGALEHVRIAHLTDLHFGRVTPESVQRAAVRLTNEAEPDLVVITGDFVCHSTRYLDQLQDVLAGLSAPTFAVLGNHDYWSGADDVLRALAKANVAVLRNQNTTVELRGQKLAIVGLDDAYTGHASREQALRGLDRSLPAIALSHIAEEADGLWHAGVPLVLAGHTHAGQITVARLHEMAIGRLAGHKYVHGLYGCRRASEAGGAVYVGAGIGAAVMPLRMGERGRREVAIFELGLEPGAFEEHHVEQAALRGRAPSAKTQWARAAKVARRDARRANR
jgi:predicted MPP superfamily phosphohydrolase